MGKEAVSVFINFETLNYISYCTFFHTLNSSIFESCIEKFRNYNSNNLQQYTCGYMGFQCYY